VVPLSSGGYWFDPIRGLYTRLSSLARTELSTGTYPQALIHRQLSTGKVCVGLTWLEKAAAKPSKPNTNKKPGFSAWLFVSKLRLV